MDKWGTAGIDETYTGRGWSKVIHFAVSPNGKGPETRYVKKLTKTVSPSNKKDIIEDLRTRKYVFSVLNNKKLSKVPYQYRLGLVFAGLFHEEPVENTLELHMDGLIDKDPALFAREAVSYVTGLDERNVSVYFGKDLDKHVPLVNLAHKGAEVFKDKPSPKRQESPYRKPLTVSELVKMFGLESKVAYEVLNDSVLF